MVLLPVFVIIIFPLKWFDSEIEIYAKYFVLSYSLDVVSRLSYLSSFFWTFD